MRLAILLLALLISRDGNAQVLTPSGVTRHATQAVTLSSRYSPSPALAIYVDTSHKSPLWQWVLMGAVAGGALGAAVGARNVSRSDDAFFPQLAVGEGIAIGVLGGAAVGGVLGSIYNAIAHPGGGD